MGGECETEMKLLENGSKVKYGSVFCYVLSAKTYTIDAFMALSGYSC
jgi:hypothetical protein